MFAAIECRREYNMLLLRFEFVDASVSEPIHSIYRSLKNVGAQVQGIAKPNPRRVVSSLIEWRPRLPPSPAGRRCPGAVQEPRA